MRSAKRRFKDAAYGQLSRMGKAFAAPKRLELLELLSQGPRTVESLADEAEISIANASQHLKQLRSVHLVESERSGQFIEYRLASPEVASVFVALRNLAEARLLELERVSEDYLKSRNAFEPVETCELLRRATSGEVTVIDVRPRTEYDAGHIPGALSIPLAELEERLNTLPPNQEIVAYCRGPYCVMAIDAIESLRAAGFVAHRLEYGVADFSALGIAVAQSDTKQNVTSRGL
jgi:rhodanese-related sulfurtransferase